MTTHIVVNTDNFGGDYPDEKALAVIDAAGKMRVKLFGEREAERVATMLNEFDHNGDDSPRYWTTRRASYKLQGGFEP